MAVLDIVKYGDPILRKKCKFVDDFSNIGTVVDNMFDSMYEAEGIGLAANQVGINLNIFVIDITHTEESDESYGFINSSILESSSNESSSSEGCLSLPNISLDINRPERIKLRYQNIDGDWCEDDFSGLLSRAIQHENDHVNGIMIIDRVSKIEKLKHKTALKELEINSKKPTKYNLARKESLL